MKNIIRTFNPTVKFSKFTSDKKIQEKFEEFFSKLVCQRYRKSLMRNFIWISCQSSSFSFYCLFIVNIYLFFVKNNLKIIFVVINRCLLYPYILSQEWRGTKILTRFLKILSKIKFFKGIVTIFHNKGEKKGCNFFLFFSIDNFFFFVSFIQLDFYKYKNISSNINDNLALV